jgi:hypothetical protein
MADGYDEAALARQRDIWTNLYGPVRASALMADLVALLGHEPGTAVRDAVARLDPEEDEQYEGWFATRW